MRNVFALFSVLFWLAAGGAVAQAHDAQEVEAINATAAALDEAFQHRDADAIKALMTPDHVAVTPYYDGAKATAYVIATLPDLDYHQTIETEAKITHLGPQSALRTFTAKFNGTFKGKPVATHVFVTEVMVKREGRWLEAFYQVTALKP